MNSIERNANSSKEFELPVKGSDYAVGVDAVGHWAAVGGKFLHLVDLESPHRDIGIAKTSNSTFSISAIQWNPHRSNASTIALVSNKDTFIWNIGDSSASPGNTQSQIVNGTSLVCKLDAHKRSVSDLSWNAFDANLLLTCAADGFVLLWDMAHSKTPSKSFKSFTAPPSLVTSSKSNSTVFASSHTQEVRVWDYKEANPTIAFTAHVQAIADIAWSHAREFELLTASQDKQVKFWDLRHTKGPKDVLQVGAPVLRAAYTPFGNGVITVAQRMDNSLKLWSLNDLSLPIHTFSGHKSSVVAFDWRITVTKDIEHLMQLNTNNDPDFHKEYQLVSLGKDSILKSWEVNRLLRKACMENAEVSDIRNELKRKKLSASTSDFVPLDLSQEFILVKKNGIPGVQVEKLDIESRSCIISIEHQNKTATLKISFPELYPNGAAPSFEFLPSSNLSVNAQVNLAKILGESAQHQVALNRCCLEHCLGKVVLLLKHVKNLRKLDKDAVQVPNAPPNLSKFSLSTVNLLDYFPTRQLSMTTIVDDPLSSSPTSPSNPSPIQSASRDVITYKVKPTDTLAGIALTYSMKPEQIKQINSLHSNQLIPGQVLLLRPPGASTPPMKDFLSARKNLRPRAASATDKPSIGEKELKHQTSADDSRLLSKSPHFQEGFLQRASEPQEVVKEVGRYCRDTFSVTGTITLTHEVFVFEPHMDDPHVIKNGVLPYQLYIKLTSMFDIQIIKENSNYFYEDSLEISVLKDMAVSIHDFLLPDTKLRSLYKKLISWASANTKLKEQEETEQQSINLEKLTVSPSSSPTPEFHGSHLPTLIGTSTLLTPEGITELHEQLPSRLKDRKWKLLFTTQVHGVSLNTFYTLTQDSGPSIILVEDTNRAVFGGFVNESWRVEPRYYGNGECFLFTLQPKVNFYHWTQKNRHFMCSRRDFVALGGGNGFGLWLDSDLNVGSSAECLTFGNSCLASADEFQVTVVEVWGFR